jgi:hypothetical protein
MAFATPSVLHCLLSPYSLIHPVYFPVLEKAAAIFAIGCNRRYFAQNYFHENQANIRMGADGSSDADSL